MAVISLDINENDKILIIAPHPDDECIGVGGVISLYPDKCDIVVLTDGREGNKNVQPEKEASIRKKQFEHEMKLAKVNSYIWKGLLDGSLICNGDCVEDISFEDYTKIFLPWRDDNHVDHTAAFLYSYNRIKKVCDKDVEIYEYEVHVPFHDVTHFLNITNVIDKKLQLIQCHKDQLENLCYDKQMLNLAKYRACQLNKENQYYETYVKVDLNATMTDGVVEREKTLSKYVQFFQLLTKWISLYQNKKKIAEWLKKRNLYNVTIYGYADIGKLLYNELSESDINVIQILDKKEFECKNKECNVINPKNGDINTQCIIVTAIFYYEEIKMELLKKGYSNILSINHIIDDINQSIIK